MRENKGPCGIQTLVEHQRLQIYNRKIDHLRQLFGVCYGETTQLDQDYHLFHYSLVYTEDLHAKFCQMSLISLGRHHKLLMMD